MVPKALIHELVPVPLLVPVDLTHIHYTYSLSNWYGGAQANQTQSVCV